MSWITAAAAFGLKLDPMQLGILTTFLTMIAAGLVRIAPDVFALAHLNKPVPKV
jgi:hypothetical protein